MTYTVSLLWNCEVVSIVDWAIFARCQALGD
jgi:hypothetical protein